MPIIQPLRPTSQPSIFRCKSLSLHDGFLKVMDIRLWFFVLSLNKKKKGDMVCLHIATTKNMEQKKLINENICLVILFFCSS